MRGSLVIFLGAFSAAAAVLIGVQTASNTPAARSRPIVRTLSAQPSVEATDDDDDEELEGKRNGVPKGKARGLLVTFQPAAGKPEFEPDTRVARLVALFVPEKEAPSPFTPAGPFSATFEGEITIPFRTEATFSAEGRGAVEVLINDKSAFKAESDDFSKASSKPAKLKKGLNRLVVKYGSPQSGDAVLRLAWQSEEFEREPIPPISLVHDPKNPVGIAGRKIREGRDLIANLRCLKCHKAEVSPAAMPELETDAPSLVNIGSRLDQSWMAAWIANPRALRPTATMPALLHGDVQADNASDIAAYLATLGQPPEDDIPHGPDRVAEGGRLFAHLGCIGCHTAPDRKDFAADPKRVPLYYVSSKWNSDALQSFLKQPDKHYTWIRMPRFGFSNSEAASLAAYLLSNSPPSTFPRKLPVNPQRGKELFATIGCTNCHALPDVPAAKYVAFKDIPAQAWSKGCLDPELVAAKKAPDFGLSEGQRQALKTLATTGLASLTRDAPPEFAERQIKQLRCESCHRRDGQDDAWSDLKTETAGLLGPLNKVEINPDGLPYPAEEVRPALTWAGEKLKPEWMAKFIAGEIAYKPRPYIHARMPAFPNRAAGIAKGLAYEHGNPAISPADPEPKAELVTLARDLIKPTGLGCASCHKLGQHAAVGVFEAPGVNFVHVRSRIRKPYFDRWIRSPLRVEPETKMPTFFNNKKSAITTILGGDAEKQSDALWNFLLQGDKIGAGE